MTYVKEDARDSGDVGRRIIERQQELKLSTAQLAERAGMAPDYLEYLEHTPTAEPPKSALLRIAEALKMSASELLGGEQGQAQGQTRAAREPHLSDIKDSECRELLSEGGIGRVVFRAEGRPVAFPVNFKTLDDDVIFRSRQDGEVGAIPYEEPVSFEVDRIDDAMSEGWSVLATGTVHQVRADDQLRKVEALGIEPWAGAERHAYFRLAVTSLTGRRIDAVR
jgi:nitroimidazol reductase NimA-like FMN-containing flavoprotein (pyridoxamine 5'-phosphate oxidase superfamily)